MYYVYRSIFLALTLIFPAVLPVTASGTLIVSNYPETLTGPGRIYHQSAEKFPLRFVYYHKNGYDETLGYVVSLRNTGPTPASVRLLKGFGGPSIYGKISGHVASRAYFNRRLNKQYKSLTIEPGKRIIIASHKIKPNEVSAGILDIESTSPHLDLSATAIDSSPHLSSLPDTSLEPLSYGKFDTMTRPLHVKLTPETTIEELSIGGPPYLRDSTRDITLKGNYGLLYNIEVVIDNNSARYRRYDVSYLAASGAVRGLIIFDDTLLMTQDFKRSSAPIPETIRTIVVGPRQSRRFKLQLMPQPGAYYPIRLTFSQETTVR